MSQEPAEVTLDRDENGVYCYHGVPYTDIVAKWNEQKGGRPAHGDRHQRMLELSGELRRIADNKPANVLHAGAGEHGRGRLQVPSARGCL